MARDLRSATADVGRLCRVSLNPSHWRQARWMLRGEAVPAMTIGVAGLVDTYLGPPWLPLTPALSATLLAIGLAAAVASMWRPIAVAFSVVLATASLYLVVISAVAAAHHQPGPLALTNAAILLWALLFCYHIGVGMWLVPDRVAGPAWLPRPNPIRTPPNPSGYRT
ncbi:hypothetical protein [Mycolicibacterium fortuitum]|jgi:hypothetical protein|uniref:hypothetical protein n=1 Tax=Mycolicibacterium fortuitum TaxID=1766 RepID=UPI0007E939B2|nr:hypothetical protein [Mycolicibacterium fortuitum]MCA4752639.1 hypothetical protein [Mycolicibacterium fortuitum]NOQ61834.1 hypothetical protein [Mycolicibacterium fortuitum]OBA98606.1 hypothetical protein A5668_29965 [Mycolicibacterium fortuitum]OBG47027.1 hypothetical protein A5669_06160 [Mycolicibacterium fortuitum]OBI69230.1 hypothetical protein A5664_10345 [Mycolicibacterium fortuitum]